MIYQISDFRDMALQLLPNGPAWPRDSESEWGLLFEALLPECVRIQSTINALVDEMSPVSSTLIFDEWEAEYGLPEKCITQLPRFGQRRGAVEDRHTAIGRQDRQFFIDLAASIGFVITIDEFNESNPGPSATFYVERENGNLVGIDPTGEDWNYIWRINAPLEAANFREYPEEYGRPYVSYNNELLECTLRSYAHDHRILIFSYS